MPDTKLPDSAKVKETERNLTSKQNSSPANMQDCLRNESTEPEWDRCFPQSEKKPANPTGGGKRKTKVNIPCSCYPELTSTSQMYRTNKQYKSKAVACGYVSLFCCLSSVLPRHHVKLGTQIVNRYFPGVEPNCAVFTAELVWRACQEKRLRKVITSIKFCIEKMIFAFCRTDLV